MNRPQKSESPRLIRINRYISMCGVASRRKADEMLLAGKVVVDRKIVSDLGTKIDPARNKVFVEGKQITPVLDYVYLVMNKPKDTITTLSDERGRTTVMSLIRTNRRVYPIGRLDRNTTGVLLFTNDGDFAHRLMHPKFEIPKSYQATLDKVVSHEHVEQLRKGVRLEDGMTAPADVFVLRGGRGKEIGIVIHEGRNRQVRTMFEKLGYDVLKLDRVAYGPITKEGLGRGETRSLTRSEVRGLKRLAGLEAT
jgi:23S rRNA pseudouridine2605 synthase